MSSKTTDTENRTNVNVSKEFRDKMQKATSLYYIKTGKKITIGNAVEAIIDGCDETLLNIYKESCKLANSMEK
jgi:hypothetical protein